MGERQQANHGAAGGLVALIGEQRLEGARVFVVPNPSGRNANYSFGEMLTSFRALRRTLARTKIASAPDSVDPPAGGRIY